jgi:Arc/MetJ family transcription regulator
MQGNDMRTTLTLDDELIKQAQEYTGIEEKSALVRKALKTLIELEASRRLALLGGSMPDFPQIPRRRFAPEGKKKA